MRCARSPGAALHRADAGDELAEPERLHDVVVGADLQEPDAVELVLAGGDDDDRHVGAGADAAADLAAVEIGETEVEQDEVGGLGGVDAPRRRCEPGSASNPSSSRPSTRGTPIVSSSSTTSTAVVSPGAAGAACGVESGTPISSRSHGLADAWRAEGPE